MVRTMCVWFPEWPLHRRGEPPDEPAQAIGAGGRVESVNAAAAAAGIRIGMHRGEAEGVVPSVVTVERDLTGELVAFEPVVAVVEDLVPKVEIVEPGLLFVPVEGAVTYYGGEGPLVARVAAAIGRVAGGCRIGVAGGPFAARQAAAVAVGEPSVRIVDDDARFLASIDVAAVGRDEFVATLRWLGITTLGELARLPEGAVASRFGSSGRDAHRLASGRDRSPHPRDVPEDRSVRERFSPPLRDLEQSTFAARRMASELVDGCAAKGVAPFRIVITGEAADGTTRQRTWRSAEPLDARAISDRARWQIRAWAEGTDGGIRGGLAGLRLEPGDLSGAGRQLPLGEDVRALAASRRALAEVRSIVGVDGMLQAHPQGGRDPTERVSWHRWGEDPVFRRDPDAPWPGRIPGPSPALIPPGGEAIHIEWEAGAPIRMRLRTRWMTVRSWAGPWRRVGRWWRGEEAVERYQIVTSGGAFLCEVAGERARIVGIYD